MKEIDYEKIFEKVSIKDLLEYYNYYPNKRGKYRCPFHNDHNPSANIMKGKDKEWFHCFVCGTHLNAIDFVVKIENCDRKTAIAKLDRDFKLGLLTHLTPREERELKKKKAERDKKLEEERKQNEYKKEVLDKILEQMRLWEQVEKCTHITYGQYANGRWDCADTFFYSVKQQKWLEWLYDTLCGFQHPECEYDYTIGKNVKEILEKIYKNEIQI